MTHLTRGIAAFAFSFLCLCGSPRAKGVLVKFLPCPPEDSVARYDVYRSADSTQPGLPVGFILPVAVDTLRYPDPAAGKGSAWYYSIKAVNAAGLESDPSGWTEAGAPLLALPDTLRPDLSGLTRHALASSAHPLRAAAPLFSLADSSRFLIRFDSAGARLEFLSRDGRADTGLVVVRASYYAKFSDEDTVLVIAAKRAVTALAAPGVDPEPAKPRAARSATGLLVLTGLPALAEVEVFTLRGVRVFQGLLRGPEAAIRPENSLGYHAGYLTLSHPGGRILASLRIP
jgi:hypothetical protein